MTWVVARSLSMALISILLYSSEPFAFDGVFSLKDDGCKVYLARFGEKTLVTQATARMDIERFENRADRISIELSFDYLERHFIIKTTSPEPKWENGKTQYNSRFAEYTVDPTYMGQEYSGSGYWLSIDGDKKYLTARAYTFGGFRIDEFLPYSLRYPNRLKIRIEWPFSESEVLKMTDKQRKENEKKGLLVQEGEAFFLRSTIHLTDVVTGKKLMKGFGLFRVNP